MSSELRVDLTALGEAANMLASIAAEFAAADENTGNVTSSLGNKNETHNLRHEIESFSSSWSVRRKEMQEDVTYLADMSLMVAETLGDTDKGLAAGLTDSTQPTSYTPGYTPAGGAI